MTATTKAGLAMIVLGAVLAAVGLAVGGPFVAAAVIAFGTAAIIGGLNSITTRSHLFGELGSSRLRREHTGVSAVIFGLTFLVVGLVLVVAGAASLTGSGDDLWGWVADNPGPVTMVAGGWLSLVGVGTTVSRWTHLDASTVWWQRIPGVILGVFLVTLGVMIVLFGRSIALDPPQSDELVPRILDTLADWLGGT